MSSFILAPRVGLEPTTYRLTAERSTNWANEEFFTFELYTNNFIIATVF